MTKNQKSKILTISVVVFLCAVFVVGFIWGLNDVLAMEGSYPPNVLTEAESPAPEEASDAVFLLNSVVHKAVTDMPKSDIYREYSFKTGDDGYIIETDADEYFVKALKYVMGEIDDGGSALTSALLNGAESTSTSFGESFESVSRLPVIKAADVEDFTNDYVYYRCVSCGETSDEELDHCEHCGSKLAYQLKYKDEYNVTLDLKEGSELLNANYDVKTPEEVIAVLSEGLSAFCTIDSLKLDYTDLKLNYRVRRTNNELDHLNFISEIHAVADVTMTGRYADLGTHSVGVYLIRNDHQNYTWPSLVLSEHEMAIEPKKSDNLQATLTCEDPTKPVVTWTSSDESILTVDEEGYFKAGKQTGSAVVTASFEYNGKVYSDECTVNIRYSVESMKMKTKKVSLAVSDTAQLKVTISPKNATVTSVTWYTENEDIAVVDENGVVTAVAPGTVTVYALSDDGYYKSSSEVTVYE